MENLIKFINSHAGCKVETVLNSGARLEVSSHATINGQAVKVVEQIPATLKAARALLGY